jgi:hypothetical protein
MVAPKRLVLLECPGCRATEVIYHTDHTGRTGGDHSREIGDRALISTTGWLNTSPQRKRGVTKDDLRQRGSRAKRGREHAVGDVASASLAGASGLWGCPAWWGPARSVKLWKVVGAER